MNLKTITLSTIALLGAFYAWSQPAAKIEIPFCGNAYVTGAKGSVDAQAPKIISTRSGRIVSWDDKSTVLSLYFKVGATGGFDLSVNASTPSAEDSSELLFTLGSQKHKVTISGPEKSYPVGRFEIEHPGYVRIDIRGLKRTGRQFGDISGFTAEGEAVSGENHYIPYDKLEDCYWYRRGPSVHMGYTLPEKEDIEYFYSEVTVPKGRDVNGTYFMLTGFREGYMGIQSAVTDEGEKRRTVLFSVWSPFTTDNPNEIPDSLHVKVLAKGNGVTAQNFGNEGSGKQSFMQYPWKTGKTYKTLVQVRPDGKGNTVYTGYFCNEKGEWMLLARFLRPRTDTYYKGAHSFLECFKPETSTSTRSVEFKNQWACDKNGVWHEITDATFTCDGTGLSGVRTDMYGDENNGAFMLQNCGFFDQTTRYRSSFTRPATGSAPEIDFEALEALAR